MAHVRTVSILLRGGRVTADFRAALFDAAARSGMTVNEFCLMAVGEKLARSGAGIVGVFEPGDLQAANDDGLKNNQSEIKAAG